MHTHTHTHTHTHGAAPAGVAPLESPFNLVLNVKMPIAKADFNTTFQKTFKEAMASAAGIPSGNVDIVNIFEDRRRQGKSSTIETKLRATDSASLQALTTKLGSGDAMLKAINAELKSRGLPESTGVSPKVASVQAAPLSSSSTRLQTLSGSSYRLSWAFGFVLVLLSASGISTF